MRYEKHDISEQHVHWYRNTAHTLSPRTANRHALSLSHTHTKLRTTTAPRREKHTDSNQRQWGLPEFPLNKHL